MRVQSFIIDHFTLVLMEHFFMANLQGYICVWKKYIVIFHTIKLEIMHSHPRYHIHAIISSVVITDWPCVATWSNVLSRVVFIHPNPSCKQNVGHVIPWSDELWLEPRSPLWVQVSLSPYVLTIIFSSATYISMRPDWRAPLFVTRKFWHVSGA